MIKRPEIIVFAGPNGSGKSTITEAATIILPYINADEIKKATGCTDQEAATLADLRREDCIKNSEGFTFETVLSTSAKLDLLRQAKEEGYFIRGYFVLTVSPKINADRVRARVEYGGHDVPRDKIYSRYVKSLENVPQFIQICDVCHIYDNTVLPVRIFKKRKDECFFYPSKEWSKKKIIALTGIEFA